MAHTELTQVQAEVGSLHQAGVLTHGPNIEVHKDGQAGECCHSEPNQEEQVGQENELRTQRQHISRDRQERRVTPFNGHQSLLKVVIAMKNV